MVPLTGAFLVDLGAATQTAGPVVIFFDAAEKMTRETAAWVIGELYRAVQARSLTNVIFVHCGREKPTIDRFMGSIAEEAELGPLDRGDLIMYLRRRGLDEADPVPFAELLFVVTKGNPLQVATVIDAWIKERNKRS
jgi:predicted ATPase